MSFPYTSKKASRPLLRAGKQLDLSIIKDEGGKAPDEVPQEVLDLRREVQLQRELRITGPPDTCRQEGRSLHARARSGAVSFWCTHQTKLLSCEEVRALAAVHSLDSYVALSTRAALSRLLCMLSALLSALCLLRCGRSSGS